MTEEAQRIAIAEACGWKDIERTNDLASIKFSHVGYEVSDPMCGISLREGRPPPKKYLPDYINDLNALHEAEKTLTYEQQGKYLRLLAPNPHSNPTMLWFPKIHATAAQRSGAFLQAKGLWVECSERTIS